MVRMKAALRRTASVGPTHARMVAAVGRLSAPTSVPVPQAGVVSLVLKVSAP